LTARFSVRPSGTNGYTLKRKYTPLCILIAVLLCLALAAVVVGLAIKLSSSSPGAVTDVPSDAGTELTCLLTN
jgi:hypothetical protein